METIEFQEQLNRIEAASLSQKNVFTFDEACRFTGLSRSHLYKLTSGQRVPHSKPNGKLVYFDRLELEAWLLNNRINTTDEVETQAQKYCMSNKKGSKK